MLPRARGPWLALQRHTADGAAGHVPHPGTALGDDEALHGRDGRLRDEGRYLQGETGLALARVGGHGRPGDFLPEGPARRHGRGHVLKSPARPSFPPPGPRRLSPKPPGAAPAGTMRMTKTPGVILRVRNQPAPARNNTARRTTPRQAACGAPGEKAVSGAIHRHHVRRAHRPQRPETAPRWWPKAARPCASSRTHGCRAVVPSPDGAGNSATSARSVASSGRTSVTQPPSRSPCALHRVRATTPGTSGRVTACRTLRVPGG